MRDLTHQMMNMDASMKSPPKEGLGTPVNPQSLNNSKRK